VWSDAVLDALSSSPDTAEVGGRAVEQILAREIVPLLANRALSGGGETGDSIALEYENGCFFSK
jgi:ATP-dependent Clp protease ATP-binding subunit ClpA